jgi:hypothetical protein
MAMSLLSSKGGYCGYRRSRGAAFAATPDPATPAPARAEASPAPVIAAAPAAATDGGLLFAHPFFRSRFIFFVIVLY